MTFLLDDDDVCDDNGDDNDVQDDDDDFLDANNDYIGAAYIDDDNYDDDVHGFFDADQNVHNNNDDFLDNDVRNDDFLDDDDDNFPDVDDDFPDDDDRTNDDDDFLDDGGDDFLDDDDVNSFREDNVHDDIRNNDEIEEDSSDVSTISKVSTSSLSSNSNIEEFNEELVMREWLFRTVNESSNILNGKVLLDVLNMYVKNATTKTLLDQLLTLIADILPDENNFPKTRYCFLKVLEGIMPHSYSENVVRHRICDTCFSYLGKWFTEPVVKVCKVCSSRDVNGVFIQFNIRAALQDAFEVGNLHHFIDKYEKECHENFDETDIFDIIAGSEMERLKDTVLFGKYDISLLCSTDGVPTDETIVVSYGQYKLKY